MMGTWIPAPGGKGLVYLLFLAMCWEIRNDQTLISCCFVKQLGMDYVVRQSYSNPAPECDPGQAVSL